MPMDVAALKKRIKEINQELSVLILEKFESTSPDTLIQPCDPDDYNNPTVINNAKLSDKLSIQVEKLNSELADLENQLLNLVDYASEASGSPVSVRTCNSRCSSTATVITAVSPTNRSGSTPNSNRSTPCAFEETSKKKRAPLKRCDAGPLPNQSGQYCWFIPLTAEEHIKPGLPTTIRKK